MLRNLAAAALSPTAWDLAETTAVGDGRPPAPSAVLRWTSTHTLVNSEVFPYGALALWDTVTGWQVVGPGADGSLAQPAGPTAPRPAAGWTRSRKQQACGMSPHQVRTALDGEHAPAWRGLGDEVCRQLCTAWG
ncbi:hypothetical protein A6A07_01230 [Streptomyces sp. CB03911]|nr:hypothetical protein A6A07_01230 [Streptomyces sp. CB03911]